MKIICLPMVLALSSVVLSLDTSTVSDIINQNVAPSVEYSVEHPVGIVVGVTPDIDIVTFGSEKCKNCTKYITAGLNYVLANTTTFKTGKFEFTNAAPCGKCFLSNLNNVSLYGDSCFIPIPNNTNLSQTRMNFIWGELHLECVCKLPDTFDKIIKELTTLINTKTPSCATTGTTITTDSAIQGGTDAIFNPQFDEFKNCIIRLAAVIPSTITIKTTWKDPKLTATVQKDNSVNGPDSVNVTDSHLIQKNYTAITTTCKISPTLLNNNFCKCLVDNQIVGTVMEQTLQTIISCESQSNDPQFKTILNDHFVCNN